MRFYENKKHIKVTIVLIKLNIFLSDIKTMINFIIIIKYNNIKTFKIVYYENKNNYS